jgi:hypothetical protein
MVVGTVFPRTAPASRVQAEPIVAASPMGQATLHLDEARHAVDARIGRKLPSARALIGRQALLVKMA